MSSTEPPDNLTDMAGQSAGYQAFLYWQSEHPEGTPEQAFGTAFALGQVYRDARLAGAVGVYGEPDEDIAPDPACPACDHRTLHQWVTRYRAAVSLALDNVGHPPHPLMSDGAILALAIEHLVDHGVQARKESIPTRLHVVPAEQQP